jgi:hypothetical protein
MGHPTGLRFAGASALALLLCACEPGLLTTVDATPSPSASPETLGSLSFNLTVANDQSAGAVDYSIVAVTTGLRREGSTQLADLDQAVDLYFGGLEPDHYQVTLSTELLTGETCSGSQTVWVGLGQPVDIRIVMLCNKPQPASGGIGIIGEVEHPPTCKLSALFVTLDPGAQGVTLAANATSDVGSVSYLWQGPGAFERSGDPITGYQCAPSGGTQHIQLTIQDADGCSEVNGVDVDCGAPTTTPPNNCASCAPDAAGDSAIPSAPVTAATTHSLPLDGAVSTDPEVDAGPQSSFNDAACIACEAAACAAERAACDASEACLAVERCIYRTECIYVQREGTTAGLWDACFCGVGADIDACYFENEPAVGPCAAAITEASGAADNLSIGQDYYDDTTALGLAGWLQFCQANSCGPECGYP